jgi:hypothetical protein
MAPEFAPGFTQVLVALFVAFAIGVAVAIYAFGRLVGWAFPPARHVAPLALGALAVWLAPIRDGRLLALWVVAGLIGTIDAVLRDVARRHPPPGPTPPVAPGPAGPAGPGLTGPREDPE